MTKTPFSNDSTPEKFVCFNCIGEQYLREKVQAWGQPNSCSYCDRHAKTNSISEISSVIKDALQVHYIHTNPHPNTYQSLMQNDKEFDYVWRRDGSPILETIQAAAGINPEIAEDILQFLNDSDDMQSFDGDIYEEKEFSPDAYYQIRDIDDNSLQFEWSNFEKTLLCSARFFNQNAIDLLSRIFKDLWNLKTNDNQRLIVKAGPNTKYSHLFRARAFYAPDVLFDSLNNPCEKLGPPPSNFASNGRMNARGISVFYGALDAKVAISEVRPPVGSEVVVCKFNIDREIKLLNLSALSDIKIEGSIFDPQFADKIENIGFLRRLCKKMTSPVMPEEEHWKYLPTQAIADFLSTLNDPNFDGIIYPSVQAENGINVVLFHHASLVAPIRKNIIVEKRH